MWKTLASLYSVFDLKTREENNSLAAINKQTDSATTQMPTINPSANRFDPRVQSGRFATRRLFEESRGIATLIATQGLD